MKINCNKIFGFTLVEVLIVLGIIGMIADMTIPNLKRDIDKIVYVTQLKKILLHIPTGYDDAYSDRRR